MTSTFLMTAKDIRTAEIDTHWIWEGYDIQQVDDLLDRIAVSMQAQQDRIVQLEHQLQAIRKENSHAVDQ
ncbi:DivIVA domain-containing protein [Bifidobacterium biavatii]|uniref:Uncharacterized protein n=1 Tax=Bifidobacterium biavatii DSM 23969 TaxID=1437608 RepID=A0A086ZYX8_9BIFI|nr:DivIVA domain-containing protein [Bifidobacterium biavatii]KFI51728.1 hypothetical protein BBIA_0642 [Bifidobacterium biavatii DSM 23969]